MQFWPFGVGILAIGLAALCAIALFIRLGRFRGQRHQPAPPYEQSDRFEERGGSR